MTSPPPRFVRGERFTVFAALRARGCVLRYAERWEKYSRGEKVRRGPVPYFDRKTKPEADWFSSWSRVECGLLFGPNTTFSDDPHLDNSPTLLYESKAGRLLCSNYWRVHLTLCAASNRPHIFPADSTVLIR